MAASTSVIGTAPDRAEVGREAAAAAKAGAGDGKSSAKARRKAARRWLESAARPGRGFVMGASLMGCLAGAAVIVQAFTLALLIEQGLFEGQPLADLTMVLSVLGGAVVARALFTYIQDSLGAEAARRVGLSVNQRLTGRLLREGPSLTRTRDSGTLATAAVEQVMALEGYVARYRPQRLIALVVPLMIIAAAIPANWAVAVFFALTGPLVPVAMAVIGIRAAAANTRQFEALARMGGHFLDRLRGLTTLKLFGQADVERRAINTVSDSFRRRTMRVLRIAFLTSASLEFFSSLAVAAVALYVGLGMVGVITFGPVADMSVAAGLFVLLLAPEFFQPLRQLGTYYHDQASALGAAEVLMGLVPASTGEARPLPPQRSADGRHAAPWAPKEACPIALSGVTLAFPNGRSALDDVSLAIGAGECVALVGPSGSGKSSLIDVILGFQRPTAGSVSIGDHGLGAEDWPMMPSLAAWASQRPYLFHASIAENIALGVCDPSDPAVKRAADAARVTDFAKDLPQGLHTPIGERGFGLSGGQARRVAIARAFLKDAPIVLLDEPTANLDRDTEGLIIESIKRLKAGRTTVICTHSDRLAAIADRKIHLDQGRIGQVPDGAAAAGAAGGKNRSPSKARTKEVVA
ncbi:MAG: thiol reductant ABC exporter subunit CydD [Alphaproteobacteria bacterium]